MLFPLLAMAQSADRFAERAWVRFARSPALAHTAETVEVASAGRTGDRLDYRARLTRRRLGRVEAVQWADSRACPALRAVLTRMEALEMPRPDAYGIGPDNTDIIVDGTSYWLEAPSTFSSGKLRIESNVGSPLAAWVDASMTALAPCWTAAPAADRH